MNYINATLCKVFLFKFQLNHINANYDNNNNDLGQRHQPSVGRLNRCVTVACLLYFFVYGCVHQFYEVAWGGCHRTAVGPRSRCEI